MDLEKDAERVNNKELDKEYELPDGEKVILNEERFLVPEILFDPSKLGKGKILGCHELIFKSI